MSPPNPIPTSNPHQNFYFDETPSSSSSRTPSPTLPSSCPHDLIPIRPLQAPLGGSGSAARFDDDGSAYGDSPTSSATHRPSIPNPPKHERQAQKIIDHIQSSGPAPVGGSSVLSSLLRLQGTQIQDPSSLTTTTGGILMHTPFEVGEGGDFGTSTGVRAGGEAQTVAVNRNVKGTGAAGRKMSLVEVQQEQIRETIADALAKRSFLLRLNQALVIYGAPTHRIEDAMETVSRALEVKASYAYSPGLMMISFVDIATHTSETHLLRDTGGFDLGRLEQVYQIMQRVCRHEATVSVALSELEAVMRRAPYYSKLAYLTSWGVASGMVAPTAFGGSWVDCGVSLVGGMCVGLMSLLGGRLTAFNNVFQVAASFVVALLARGLHHHVCFTTVVLSGIVVLLPGFMLTLSIMELTSRSINSGATRLLTSVMDAFFQGFGASLGLALWEAIEPGVPLDMSTCSNKIDPRWLIVLFPIIAVSINVQFGALPQQLPLCIIVNSASFIVSYVVGLYVDGAQLPTAIAAFTTGLICNIYSKFTGRLGFVPITGAVLILVPGSVGVRSALQMLAQGDPTQGSAFAVQMVTVASGITLGLFMATFLVYPFGKRQTALLTF